MASFDLKAIPSFFFLQIMAISLNSRFWRLVDDGEVPFWERPQTSIGNGLWVFAYGNCELANKQYAAQIS